MSSQDDPVAACPVDHKTREAWLAQARASGQQPTNPHGNTPAPSQPASQSPVQQSCDSSTLDQTTATTATTSSPPPHSASILSQLRLATDREVSTIPRALPDLPQNAAPNARLENSERDTGSDKATGNWIYPSEQMFFDAMRRKSYDPQTSDMKTIVPIHNAVNERAWHEIKQWEAGRSDSCGGPKLASFSGLSTQLTPRARWNALMGYQAPFDRHDWVVDRCGQKVEYVIDFYAGKSDGEKRGEGLNFYLDVRPKLNSLEGWKMRIGRYWGFS